MENSQEERDAEYKRLMEKDVECSRDFCERLKGDIISELETSYYNQLVRLTVVAPDITAEQVDQPEWCSEDIKIKHNPVFWMIVTAVVAGLALFLIRSC